MSVVICPVILLAVLLDIRGCVCDPAVPASMEARECNLTRLATEQHGSQPVFFIKDANPTKPDRWLAIPHPIRHTLNDMSPAERNAYWRAALKKAHALWGNDWAVAVNGLEKRTQCQLHAHIGKLLATADSSGGIVVKRIQDIPVPPPGSGIWIQPEGKKLRVHPGEMAGELNIMR